MCCTPASSSSERAYGIYSFLPNVAAHLKYGDVLNVDFPAFSDAMTQTDGGVPLVGRYVPPNVPNVTTNDPMVPRHITPHALAVPFAALDALDDVTAKRFFEAWLLLRADTSGVWHPSYSQDPFGFEVVASPLRNQAAYSGADEGRYIFETLSQSYIALSLFEGLTGNGGRNSRYFANHVPGFAGDVSRLLTIAYPTP